VADVLRCVDCGCTRIKVEVTGSGQLHLDFSKASGDQIIDHDMHYVWSVEAPCHCLECGREGPASGFAVRTALDVIKKSTAFIKRFEPDGESAAKERAALISEVETFCKEHQEELEAIQG
jgi:hypothetical protein